jgi:hypothetical protein
METLQELFEEILQNYLSYPVIGVKLIKKKLDDAGIILTSSQEKDLEKN